MVQRVYQELRYFPGKLLDDVIFIDILHQQAADVSNW